MASYSSILACEIPWTEEPGRLQSLGSGVQRKCLGWGYKFESMRWAAERNEVGETSMTKGFIQSCLTLCNPMGCRSPGSAIHGIFQERILGWVAILSPGVLPDPGIKLPSLAVSCTGKQILYH